MLKHAVLTLMNSIHVGDNSNWTLLMSPQNFTIDAESSDFCLENNGKMIRHGDGGKNRRLLMSVSNVSADPV